MPNSKKKRKEKKLAEQQQASAPIDTSRKQKRLGIIIASVVILLILAIIGVSYYYLSGNSKYMRINIISVDGTDVRMDYFLKRTKLAGASPMTMVQTLTNELLVQKGTDKYGIAVSPDEVTDYLKTLAGSDNQALSDKEYQEWFRQRLNDSDFSAEEYSGIWRTSLLAKKLQEYLAERVPTSAEQVHIHGILVQTLEDAQAVKARLESGENFADVAKQVTLDDDYRDNGGDLGWFPRGVLDFNMEEAAFSLTTDNISDPIPLVGQTTTEDGQTTPAIVGYRIIKISETAVRPVDADSLQTLKDGALEKWLSEEIKLHDISYNFNSEINAWINWQLSKGTPNTGGSGSQQQTQQH